ncbi:MAG: recombinase family protein [Aristaeellaceae bacterium]
MRLDIANPEAYHAALYIRLSKEDENDGPSESVTNQQSLLNEFVRQHHLAVHDTYIDDGWSGTSFDRPDFRRMIGDIEAGHVNMVITKDLSRLGRDYIMTGHYMERYFPEKRVRYISLLDGIDTGVESSANDITPFRAIMNDLYARDISRKIRSVKHDKQRKGQFIGGKPVYGYKKHPTEKNRIVIDGEAAVTVRRIFAMALEGVSCRQIAIRLNEEHVPSPAVYGGLPQRRTGAYAGLWSAERIADMLKNETYTGSMVQGRTVKLSYKSKKCLKQAPQSWVVVENTHEPLVDREAFRRVQQLLASRRRTRSRTYDFLLKGLIFCHECGYPLAVMNRPTADGSQRLFFVCRTYQRFTRAGACTCHTIKEQTVTDAVIARVREACETCVSSHALLPIAREAVEQAQKKHAPATGAQTIQSRLDSLAAHLDRMYMDRLSGLLADADFERIYGKIKGERSLLEEKRRALDQQKQSPVPTGDRARELAQRFMDSALTSRALLVTLIERVELTADKRIIIRFRFREPEAGQRPPSDP